MTGWKFPAKSDLCGSCLEPVYQAGKDGLCIDCTEFFDEMAEEEDFTAVIWEETRR